MKIKTADDYKSLFDLNVELVENKLNSPLFLNSDGMFRDKATRDVELFVSEHVNVLIFDYSFNGLPNIFIRIKTPFKDYDGYDTNKYYPIIESGGRFCADNRSYSAKNPWEKYIKEFIIGTNGDHMYIDKISHHNNVFLIKNESSVAITQELRLNYVEFPDVRHLGSVYIVNSTSMIVVMHYSEFKYHKEIVTIHPDNRVEKYKLVKDTVYRDGGTTYCDLEDVNGVIHKYFTPSPLQQRLGNEVSPATFDGEEMTLIEDDQINDMIISHLELLTLPKDK